jgi:hypothetical protein
MNIDEKIKQQLEQDAAQLDPIFLDDSGLLSRLLPIFKGGMKWWVWLVNLLALLTAALMFWCGYRFWYAEITQVQIFWGVAFLASLQMQGMLKNWLFMEMNRTSNLREIKRVEIAVARLSEKLGL